MPSHWFTTGLKEVVDRTINLSTETKLMLCTSAYTPTKSDLVVDAGISNDAQSAEISVTGYTGGYGGPGRKALTGGNAPVISADLTNSRVEIVIPDQTWTSLGVGATIASAILIKEGAVNDTSSRLIAYWDLIDKATDGGNIVLDFDAIDGNLRITVI